jgi:hypothetical protein
MPTDRPGERGAQADDGDDRHGRAHQARALTSAQRRAPLAEPLGGAGEAVGAGPEAVVEQLRELEVAVVVSHATRHDTCTERSSDRLSCGPDHQ